MKKEVQNAVVTVAEPPPPTTAEIRTRMAECEAERVAATQRAAKLRAETSQKLLRSTNAEMEAHDAAIREADRNAERAGELLKLLKPYLEEAKYREDQVERHRVYEAAIKAQEEAERLELEDYPKLASQLRDIMVRLEELAKQIEAANNYRPDSDVLNPNTGQFDFVPSIRFEGFRGVKGRGNYTEITTETYYVDGEGQAVNPVFINGKPTLCGECIQKTREKKIQRFEPDQYPPYRLSVEVRLPGVKLYDPDFWKPHDPYS